MGKDSRDRAVECSGKTEKNKKEDMWLGSVVSVLKRGKNVNVPAEASTKPINFFFSQIGENDLLVSLSLRENTCPHQLFTYNHSN